MSISSFLFFLLFFVLILLYIKFPFYFFIFKEYITTKFLGYFFKPIFVSETEDYKVFCVKYYYNYKFYYTLVKINNEKNLIIGENIKFLSPGGNFNDTFTPKDLKLKNINFTILAKNRGIINRNFEENDVIKIE